MARHRAVSAGLALSIASLLAAPGHPLLAQDRPKPDSGTWAPAQWARAQRFAVLPSLRDLARGPVVVRTGPVPEKAMREQKLPRSQNAPGVATSDEAVQAAAPLAPMPDPLLSFDGLSNQDNANVLGFRVYPPDPNGDVGPNHYVQTVNLLVRVFDKTGTALTAPFKMSSLFAMLGGICATGDRGDPIVLYDPLADRWLLSQFAFPSNFAPPYHQCVAVSRTGDPTGAYFLYDFVVPNAEFNDYPKFGVWPDAYYLTVNQFFNFASFDGTGAYAFDRTKMLAGDPSAGFVYFNLNLSAHPEGIAGMLPSDMDGLNPPPSGAPNVFAYFVANEFGDPADGVRLFDFRPNFASPGSSTFVERAESPLAVAAFNPVLFDVPQPSGPPLDAIADRLLARLAYRNFGSHESLVVNHTVGLSPGAGIRYYELRRPSPGSAFAVNEQATFAPNAEYRWMGSAAQDGQGNIAVGYNVSSASTFPSIRYAGRLATDPPGGLFQSEVTLVAGTGVQTGADRWGDYSGLAVDPSDDCTFWYTSEYYTSTSQASSPVGWLTRVGTFRFPGCTPVQRGTLVGTVVSTATGAPIAGAEVRVLNAFSALTDGLGRYSMPLPAGTYDVTASAIGYQPATVSGVTVTHGGITTANLALAPRVPTQIRINAGDGQTGLAGAALPVRPSVVVLDADDQPVPGVSVTFAVASGGGSVIAPATQLTNSSGVATVGGWQLGPAAGPNTLTATSSAPVSGNPVTFTATAVVLGVSINDVAVAEGNPGTTANAQFTVSLSAPVPAGQSASVSFATQDGSAIGSGSGANNSGISVPNSGNATPYPSTITIPAIPGVVGKLTVTLTSLSHTFPEDLDVLLVGPSGQSVVLMSDAGAFFDVANLTLTFDDSGPPLPTAAPITSGTYRPTNIADAFADNFGGPAPPPPYGSALAAFNGTSPAGTWRLFVVDDVGGDSGSIAAWSLSVQVVGTDYLGTAGTLTFSAGTTTQSVNVAVLGDLDFEANEDFFVNLSSPVNASLADSQGRGTILNDESGVQSVVWTNLVGVSATGNSLTKTGAVGWNAGAVSTRALSAGDGAVEFTATGPLRDRVAGFATTDQVTSFTHFAFGLNLSDGGNVWLVEGGQFIGMLGTYVPGDRFRVAVESGIVRYYRNGTLIHQSGSTPTYPLWAAAALFHADASLGNAVLFGTFERREAVVWNNPVGVSVSDNTLTKTGAVGWNAGAISSQVLAAGGGGIEFTAAGPLADRVAGFGHIDAGVSFPDIDFGLNLSDGGNIWLVENGQFTSFLGTYVPGDRFRIAIAASGMVTYYQNGAVLRQSAAAPIYPLRADTALFHTGGVLADVIVTGEWQTPTEPVVWANAVGVSVSTNSLTKIAGTGWNAGAGSTKSLGGGNGFVEFVVPGTPADRIVGFAVNGHPTSFAHFAFGLEVSDGGNVWRVEGGQFTGHMGTYVPGDRFRVSIENGLVRYYRNGNRIHDSAQSPAYPLWAGASLYQTGGVVGSVVVAGAWQVTAPVVWMNPVGVSVAGSSLTKTAADGWNAGAASVQTLASGDGEVEFEAAGPLADRVAGLGQAAAALSYQDVGFGLNLSDGGNVWLIEAGQFTAHLGTYAPGDRFRVAIESGVVRYYRNSILLHESAVAPSYPLRVDAAFYHPGASIDVVRVIGPWQGF